MEQGLSGMGTCGITGRVSVWDGEKALEIDRDGYMTLRMYLIPYTQIRRDAVVILWECITPSGKIQKIPENARKVLYLDLSGDYMVTCIHKISSSCTLNIWAFFTICIIP